MPCAERFSSHCLNDYFRICAGNCSREASLRSSSSRNISSNSSRSRNSSKMNQRSNQLCANSRSSSKVQRPLPNRKSNAISTGAISSSTSAISSNRPPDLRTPASTSSTHSYLLPWPQSSSSSLCRRSPLSFKGGPAASGHPDGSRQEISRDVLFAAKSVTPCRFPIFWILSAAPFPSPLCPLLAVQSNSAVQHLYHPPPEHFARPLSPPLTSPFSIFRAKFRSVFQISTVRALRFESLQCLTPN